MSLSQQVTELRAASSRVKTEVAGVAERFATKVAEMQARIDERGEVDPDLSADVAELSGMADELKAIGAPTEPVEPTPVEPSPVEPSPTEPE